MTLTVRTNHVPRPLLDWSDLTETEQKEFDYFDADTVLEQQFFRFKKQVYAVGDFMRIPASIPEFDAWHGYSSDSAFSGVLIHVSRDGETVIVGQYFS